MNEKPLIPDPDVYWEAKIGPLDDNWLHRGKVKMRKKLKANAFSDEVRDWLNARTRFGEHVEWKANYRLDPRGRDFVDVVGLLKSRATILIEIELHREDP